MEETQPKRYRRCALQCPAGDIHPEGCQTNRDGSFRVGPGRVGSFRVGPGRVGSFRVEPGRVGSSRVGQGQVGSSRVGPGQGMEV